MSWLSQQTEKIPDEEVLTLSLKKPAYFEVIVARYEEAFLRKAQEVLHSREDSEDVVAEAFSKIYFHGSSFKKQPGASFRSWAYRVLLNTAFSHYRKLKRQNERQVWLGEEFDWQLVPDGRFKEEFGDESAAERAILVLARMPETMSRLFRLYFWDGYSQREIAEMEEISTSAVKARMHRARKEFRRLAQNVIEG